MRDFSSPQSFVARHVGPRDQDISAMLDTLGCQTLTELIEKVTPKGLLNKKSYDLPPALSESELLQKAREYASQNKIFKSYLGQGYYGTVTPPVILRNVLENPAWYTAYTPYQAEISQGRMQALLNFQTMIIDLTGMDVANASLLDEGTAAAEAMSMALHLNKKPAAQVMYVSQDIFSQTRAVLETRAEFLGVLLKSFELTSEIKFDQEVFAVLVQSPGASGEVCDWTELCAMAHQSQTFVICAADLLSLTLIKPPGEMGADFVVGSTQRFGVPMGFGGPHAAYIACRETHKRLLPGRIIGVSKDTHGASALRLALQTREQHIRREKATSNICTAQVLLAVMASMYAVYHGPEGLKQIAQTIALRAARLAKAFTLLGHEVMNRQFFDTFQVRVKNADKYIASAREIGVQFLKISETVLSISIDETTTDSDLEVLVKIFGSSSLNDSYELPMALPQIPELLKRQSKYLQQSVFNSYHSETEMLRYIHRLQSRDLSLTHSMIPLGSCTMKLNATAEMIPVTWAEFANLHPFADADQTRGYLRLISELEQFLCELTGFHGVSVQPNAGSQGEYAGLLVIRDYHRSVGQAGRNICLISSSAHGTNPASAVMAGMKVVVVQCDDQGNIDLKDLTEKAKDHAANLAALMITYPSTHGVFEETVQQICKVVHECGGQVYMDGANMNALLGLIRPADLGVDVCHMNLHKTFCIPHGGGGPGVGPIGVAAHLKRFLNTRSVSSAFYGSASLLPISWAYIRMMGADGLRHATEVAILNANYIAQKLKDHFPLLYTNERGFIAHECILDLRALKDSCNITVDDVAKRLMDYGFHAPTMSWPVAGTLMVEPTESESKGELDRFIEAMIAIRKEIQAIESGQSSRDDNLLKNAPHTTKKITSQEWPHAYSREQAAFPLPWVYENKFWPSVGRVDNAYGDRHLVCTCDF